LRTGWVRVVAGKENSPRRHEDTKKEVSTVQDLRYWSEYSYFNGESRGISTHRADTAWRLIAMMCNARNPFVRLLVKDDPEQYELALHLFYQEHVFITKTVMPEAEWVLRFTYRFGTPEVTQALVAVIALPHVWCEDETEIRQALAWHRSGMDFADVLHLASSARAQKFVTFDRDLIRTAERLDLPVSTP
jgi:predicted nucleic-acid-binding protein